MAPVYLPWRDLDSDTIEKVARRAYSAAKVALELERPIPPRGAHSSEWIMEPTLWEGEE